MKTIAKITYAIITLFLTLNTTAQSIPPIKRRIPPQGIQIPANIKTNLQSQLLKFKTAADKISHPLKPDALIYYKAVSFALKNNEFYKPKDFALAQNLLKTGQNRLDLLAQNKSPWTKKTGLQVRGYISSIDKTVQPYGLHIPKNYNPSKKQPLKIWLHGRADKTTDLHFIQKRQTNSNFKNPNTIILHPFGRHCIGFKSAGEIDVLEASQDVQKRYNIDQNKIALMGFSMGGAGAWHIGAHYANNFAIVHPGAGFSETKLYTKLPKSKYPPSFEQKLWGIYDIPNYTRNLLNIPVIAYSGQNDKQIQAAQVMEQAYKKHGKKLTHIIGPNVKHKYAPNTFNQINKQIDKTLKHGKNPFKKTVSLQTQTLRYATINWIQALKLNQHWQDATIDAKLKHKIIYITTKNIDALKISSPYKNKPMPKRQKIVINGQTIKTQASQNSIKIRKLEKWKIYHKDSQLHKSPQLQGPIDDAFLSHFIVITPSKKSDNPKIQAWLEFEIAHFKKRWQELFRGNLIIKQDKDITLNDIKNANLILFGTPQTNTIIKNQINKTPIKWNSKKITLKNKNYPSSHHIPALIYPNPQNPKRYIVINSGPTFRENHDTTNSLQNPKLPDYAIIDINQPPNGYTSGKIITADFFNENWQLK